MEETKYMAKMRVHELAKELGIESKTIIEYLGNNGHAVKTSSNSVDEDVQNLVRKQFGKGAALKNTKPEVTAKPETAAKAETAAREKTAAKPEAPKADSAAGAEMKKETPTKPETAAKAENASKAEGNADRPRKKSSITAVYNAQYSKQGAMHGGNRRPNNGERRPNNGDRRPNNGEHRPNNSERSAKPVNGYDVRKAFERAINPEAAKEAERAERLAAKPQANRPVEEVKKEEPKRPNVYENVYQNVYDQGGRPNNNNNNSGERRQNNNGDRRPNNNGERRPNNNGDRRPNNNGDRSVRGGQGNGFNGNRGGRQDGNQRTFQNGRPNQNGAQGDRNNNRGNGYRGKESNGGRLDREIDRFNKENAAPAEELRGKESRDRDKDRNKNNRQRNDYDALGGKRQERFVNLEKNGGKKKPVQQPQPKQEEDVIRTLVLPEKLTIKELADKMKIQPSVIVKKLFLKGTMVTVNQEVDYETAEEIALEFNCICEPEEKIDVIAELLKEEDDPEDTLVARPPVVCVMGHVDHGKTSLLDAIRSTRVTDKEAGGITQHIGASVVSINGQNITFLDTPGHEAFTAMRMRGANSTDIAILVVAADDGVMPQTVEAINHAKAAGVEIIVAINKIDKPSANIERVKQELSEYDLIPEDWGGSTVFCPVSAHTKEGIQNLLEMILLTAEVLELKANPKRNARGLVIEAQLDKGRGAVATVLVQKGTLKVGQPVACGSCYGKVRAMIDDQGRRVKEAGPSTPVEILGLSAVPEAGETFVSTDSEKEARAFAETYISESKNRLIEDTKSKMSLDDLFSQIQSGNVKELNIIVKADVQGSVEAVKQSLVKLSNEEVVVKVIHGGVGAINESDVSLASASNAIIIGFNVRPDPTSKITAEKENVDIRLYKVIYNAIEDVEAAMKGMLDPIFEEKVLGHAEVRQIFKASGVGNIAGSYVLDGVFQRGCKVRISREGEQIFEGDLASLKRFKDDVKEVKAGYECGLVFEGFNDIAELDVVEAYTMVEVPR
jgi:translation initiation factor IF-2